MSDMQVKDMIGEACIRDVRKGQKATEGKDGIYKPFYNQQSNRYLYQSIIKLDLVHQRNDPLSAQTVTCKINQT